jgi:hypothetical protein
MSAGKDGRLSEVDLNGFALDHIALAVRNLTGGVRRVYRDCLLIACSYPSWNRPPGTCRLVAQ